MYNNHSIIEKLKAFEILDYFRKSRTDDPSLSVEEVLSKHEAILDEWAERNLGEVIPEENKYREVVSGETIADRPEFQKVLKLIESPDIKAILVVEIQRLSRGDLEDAGRLIKLLRYTNTLVITPMKVFDLKDEYDRDMFERELKRGNEFLEYTKKLLSRGRELSIKSGNYLGSKPVYGYDKITIVENKRKCPTLAINEERANVVRMIFDWYANENIGTSVISNRLEELKISPPEALHWTADTVSDILENPTYIGMVRWNQRKGILVVDDGEFRKTRPLAPEEERILVKGKHEAIISEELFNIVQEKRGRVHRTNTFKGRQLRNPLASLLYCECGRAMAYRHSTRGNFIYREPRIVCNGQKHCGNGSCSLDEIIGFVVDLLKQKIAEFEIEVKNGNDDASKLHENLIKNLEKKLADLDARELALWESQVSPDPNNQMPPRVFQALTEKITKEREDTETALAKARETLAAPVNYEAKRATFQKALDALLDDEVSVAEKNQLLKKCIERIEYSREPHQKNKGKGNGRGYTQAPIKLDIKLNVRPNS